ncbi:GL26471 [Drosophila persimilis]|uniref:GL26471 n=1 Tax=Drosophila persimilis TaxID=7234 RepID=B4GSK2_DROPE|nr:GL26471 [Drosophila persimilis]
MSMRENAPTAATLFIFMTYDIRRCIHYRYCLRSSTILYFIGFDRIVLSEGARDVRLAGMLRAIAILYRKVDNVASSKLQGHNVRSPLIHMRGFKRWASASTHKSYAPYATLPQAESYQICSRQTESYLSITETYSRQTECYPSKTE